MPAAVAQRASQHMPQPVDRTLSPMDGKRSVAKVEAKKDSNSSSRNAAEKKSPPRPDPTAVANLDNADGKDEKTSNAEATQPLAPPPRPIPQQSNSTDQDYFSGNHAQYSLEPNLFDASFSNPATETPGKSLLPSVAALASPASLTSVQNPVGGYGWSGSLRSGPLSPAMLSGPTGVGGGGDYFDQLRSSFPTPNESSLRTGLTPGGGGSMFPAPSPGTQAFINSLGGGIQTPGTLDFQRAAMNAASRKSTFPNGLSQAQDHHAQTANMDPIQQPTSHHHFGQHDNDAANGLFMLAQAGSDTQSANQFTVPPQPTHIGGMSQDTSPTMGKHPGRGAGSIGSISGSVNAQSEVGGDVSDGMDQSKPNTRGKNKRTTSGKASNGRRKTEGDVSAKPPASKKAKNNNGSSRASNNYDMDMEGGESDEEVVDMKEDQYHSNGKKMTDEEKRKNFLERNRVAALKCRQRKKQWLANLQQKVEIFSSENDALSATVGQLREEILNLKTILIAHKDCPIAQQQQGVGTYIQHDQDYNNYGAHHSMMQNGQQQQVMTGPPRRYS